MKQSLGSEKLVDTRRIVVCVGSGGVGKTTLAAAIALGATRRGRRSVVVTIDPARRLADALGVDELRNEPEEVAPEALRDLGVPPGGSLSAMMLDTKGTFDALVERFAPDGKTRERILHNPIYQHASDALAGSLEYSAMEKVLELSEREAFDLIVLDTPPAVHALDFLEAPERLLEFLDSRLVQLLLHPAFAAGRLGVRIFQRGTHRVLQILERISGIGFLEDLSEFLLAFEGMSEGFAQRARRVRELLLGPEAAFVLATGPARESVSHALSFLQRLEARRVPLMGIVANRVRCWPGGGDAPDRVPFDGDAAQARAALQRALEEGGWEPAVDGSGASLEACARAALETAAGYAAMVRQDADALAPLKAWAGQAGCFWRCVPEFARDVHDLEGLARVADHVFSADVPPEDGSR